MSDKSKNKMSEIDEHITRRFDIKKRLGKGAYGIVWKAIDKKSGETVAVKKIFDAFRNQTDSQRTFREIMFLQSFRNHPNIIQLHSIHKALNNRDIYLGFEYMDIDLHVVIKRGNILKDCHHRYIMYQLFNATYYIHSGNVIHRDQKPSNVLLDQHCHCKIADFGLARSLTPLNGGDGSSGGVNCGDDCDPTLTDYVATRWYRAPEILIASKRYTKGIDMWSLGCILGEMLAGKPIFPGTSTVNQVEKIMCSIPPPTLDDIATVCSGMGVSMIKNAVNGNRVPLPSLLGPNAPNDALDLIHKLLVFNPIKRLTAEQALEHKFISQYRNKSLEITLDRNIVPPLHDDVRLSVDDYRNKLYEIMSHHSPARKRLSGPKKTLIKYTTYVEAKKPEIVKVKATPFTMPAAPSTPLVKETYKSIKEKAQYHSDTKFKYAESTSKPKLTVKSDSRIPTAAVKTNIIFQTIPKHVSQHATPQRNSIGEFRSSDLRRSSPDLSKDKQKKRVYNVKNSFVYGQSFNHYNHNHGIITASALRELKTGVQ